MLLLYELFTDVRGCLAEPIERGSVWQSCGKPSTKFPHGGLVECLSIPQLSCLSFLKNSKKSKILDIFLKILIFSKFLEIWNLIDLTLEFTFLEIITSILIFNIRSTRFSVGFLQGHRAKPCQLDHFRVVCHHFSRAPVWRA